MPNTISSLICQWNFSLRFFLLGGSRKQFFFSLSSTCSHHFYVIHYPQYVLFRPRDSLTFARDMNVQRTIFFLSTNLSINCNEIELMERKSYCLISLSFLFMRTSFNYMVQTWQFSLQCNLWHAIRAQGKKVLHYINATRKRERWSDGKRKRLCVWKLSGALIWVCQYECTRKNDK